MNDPMSLLDLIPPKVTRPHRGWVVLAFGVLGFVGCLPFAPLAWWMGNADMNAINAGTMDATGRELTNAGRLLGMTATFLYLVLPLLWFFLGGMFIDALK